MSGRLDERLRLPVIKFEKFRRDVLIHRQASRPESAGFCHNRSPESAAGLSASGLSASGLTATGCSDCLFLLFPVSFPF